MNVVKRAALLRAISVATAAILVALAAVVVSEPSPAAAYDGSDFNPNLIISDDQFYDSNAMSEAQIQAFLETRINTVGGCVSTSLYCLAQMRLTTPTKATFVNSYSGGVVCTTYQGAVNERISTIIYKVQRACGISAKVLLVTLQKEQSLLTNRDPTLSRVNRAMGYLCPDSANGGCAAAGFHQQMYGAAWQFQTYRLEPVAFNFRAGRSQNIQYHPNVACGYRWTYIFNDATAALYNYTPYVPNAAALANLGVTGNSCSAYGNRNFWDYYYQWFGSPTVITPDGVTVSRIGGSDRYEVALGISRNNYPETTSTVYVANGLNFPDALSAAPAAALVDAPLILVPPTSLPANVKAEIERLTPTNIVVVGGTGSVSDAVMAQLALIAPTERRDGADRYESSRAVVAAAFSAGVDTAYLATGAGFADALSASSVAGANGRPIILVDGSADSLDQPTRDLLVSLGVTKVVIVGGPGSVTAAIEADAKLVPGLTVTRVGGSTRYAVSSTLNRAAFTSASVVFVASGMTFPDALAGAALAGKLNAPLYLVPGTCIHRPVLEDIESFGATQMTILGGPASVGPAVEAIANCS